METDGSTAERDKSMLETEDLVDQAEKRDRSKAGSNRATMNSGNKPDFPKCLKKCKKVYKEQ